MVFSILCSKNGLFIGLLIRTCYYNQEKGKRRNRDRETRQSYYINQGLLVYHKHIAFVPSVENPEEGVRVSRGAKGRVRGLQSGLERKQRARDREEAEDQGLAGASDIVTRFLPLELACEGIKGGIRNSGKLISRFLCWSVDREAVLFYIRTRSLQDMRLAVEDIFIVRGQARSREVSRERN